MRELPSEHLQPLADAARSRAWYASPAYEAIKHLRTAQYVGTVLIIEGIPEDHRSTDLLAALR